MRFSQDSTEGKDFTAVRLLNINRLMLLSCTLIIEKQSG